jgi:hypothetical protein
LNWRSLNDSDDARLLARVEGGQHLSLGVESLRRVVVDSDLEDSNFIVGLAIPHKKPDSGRPGSESPNQLEPPDECAGRGIKWVDRRVTTGRTQLTLDAAQLLQERVHVAEALANDWIGRSKHEASQRVRDLRKVRGKVEPVLTLQPLLQLNGTRGRVVARNQ